MLKKLILAVLLLWPILPAAAREIEPRAVRNPRALGADRGIVIFSLRSQMQLGGDLHVWFEAADDVARRSADHIKFERNQGVPLMGHNMIDRRAIAYAVPAGRWRLLANTTTCDTLPPPGAFCMGGGPNPTARYDGSSVEFVVQAGAVLDGGELLLEFPGGTDLGISFRQLWRDADIMRLKWRPLPAEAVARAAAPFAGLPAARLAEVREAERSAVTCQNDAAKINSGLTLPFAC